MNLKQGKPKTEIKTEIKNWNNNWNKKLPATYLLKYNSPKCHLFFLKSPKVDLNRPKSPKITATWGPRVGLTDSGTDPPGFYRSA